MEICFCGKEKAENRLTCPRCFEFYRKETRGKTNLIEWAKTQCLERLINLGASEKNPKTDKEIDLEAKKKELRELEDTVDQEVGITLQERITGAGTLRQDELQELREDIRKELWKEKGGNKLYAQVKSLQEEIKTKVTPIRDTLGQIEKTERDNSPIDSLVNLIFNKENQ